MVDEGRARRLAGRIKQIVATYVESQIKDPRLGMVTITDVRMTGDLHDATIFYTVFGDEASRADTAVALESAKGGLRTHVGKLTGVRFTPTIAFVLDSVPEGVKHIDDLLSVAAEADAELNRARAQANYAGDPDPYRKPREEADDAESDELR
jgi:ribosome-binding factor A